MLRRTSHLFLMPVPHQCVIIHGRIRSVGFDMLKQRGNWQATGTEPAQLGTEFDSIFTHEVEDISELLVEKSEMTESDARKFISTAFQVWKMTHWY